MHIKQQSKQQRQDLRTDDRKRKGLEDAWGRVMRSLNLAEKCKDRSRQQQQQLWV
jgi:hypothetical protein